MSAQQWIDDHFLSHGKTWLRENFQAFCIETNPKKENSESYFRQIRMAEVKLRITNPELFDDIIPADPLDINTVDQSIDLHQVDLTRLKIKEVRTGTWGSGTNQNKQVRVTYHPIAGLTNEQVTKSFIESIKNYEPPKMPKVKYSEGDNMLEVDLFDAHFGLLAWSKETGFGDYDIKIASEMFMNMVYKIIEWAKDYKIEKVCFPIGNDFFNSDNPLNSTAKGTIQDEDSRWMKTFDLGWKLIRDSIILLRNVAPVDVVVIRGNHDLTRTYYMGVVIESWFRDDKYIHVDNDPAYYKRVVYGKNLIGFTHGDKAKKDKLPLLMASRWPQEWAATIYRECRIGHEHHESVKEFPGCKVLTLGPSSNPSEWGASEGYDSMVESKGTIWNKDKGKIATMHCRPD